MHLYDLRKGTHHSAPLQNAFNKYGEAGLVFKKLLICESKDLLFYEQRALDILKPEYNVSKTAGSTLRIKWSLEQRLNHSKVLKGRVAWNKGKKATPQALLNQSKSHLGKKLSPETIAKLTGRKASFESICKQIAGQSKQIQCVETGQIFESGKIAGQWCVEQGLTKSKDARSVIYKAIKGRSGNASNILQRNMTAYGYHWILIKKENT